MGTVTQAKASYDKLRRGEGDLKHHKARILAASEKHPSILKELDTSKEEIEKMEEILQAVWEIREAVKKIRNGIKCGLPGLDVYLPKGLPSLGELEVKLKISKYLDPEEIDAYQKAEACRPVMK